KKLGGPAPGPEWGLDSWATSLAAITAIFATVTATITLPPVPTQIAKSTLIQLNLFFATVILIGPFIFRSVRRPKADLAHRQPDLWGWSPALLVSYAIAAGAVLGQLASLALLVWEVTGSGTFGWWAIAGIVVLGVLASWYFLVSAVQEVTEDWRAR